MIQLTKEQLIVILHEATGNVRDFVMDNEVWVDEAIDRMVKKSSQYDHKYIERQSPHGECEECEKCGDVI